MENHLFALVNVQCSKVIKTHPYSYVSSLTPLKAMHCAVAAGRAFENHFVKPSHVRDMSPSIP